MKADDQKQAAPRTDFSYDTEVQLTREEKNYASAMVKMLRPRLTSRKSNANNVSLMADDLVMAEVKEFISSGFPGIDQILGGGWAVGRVSEVSGPEGAGKSATSHMAIRSCQRAGGCPTIFDFENALDPAKMRQLEIDPSRLVYCNPAHMEEGWDILWMMIAHMKANPPKYPGLIVWDSVAGSPTKVEMSDTIKTEDLINRFSGQSKIMNLNCRKLYKRIPEVRAHVMFINQERDDVGKKGGWGGAPKKTIGGDGVKYAASQRVRVTTICRLKQGEKVTGYLSGVRTFKNRISPPFQAGKFVLDFKVGPSPELTLLQILMDQKELKKDGKTLNGFPSYVCQWDKTERITKEGWLERVKSDSTFRAAAVAKYLEVAQRKVDTDDDDESEDDE